MNERIKEIIEKVGTDCSGKWMSTGKVNELAEIIVLECIDAVQNTSLTHAYTTFDLSTIKGTIGKCVDSIKKEFDIK
jgi:hypothetical protein